MKTADKCSSCKGTGIYHKYKGVFEPEEIVPDKKCPSCYGSGFNNRYTDSLVCPYCGYDEEDSWETADESYNYECANCHKSFAFETEHTRTFTSRRVECLNGAPHRLGKRQDFEAYYYERCQDCGHSVRTPKVVGDTKGEG